MDNLLTYWHKAGSIGQSVIVVFAVLLAYIVFRTVLLKRLEKIAAATSNDFDDRLILFVKQFLSLVTLFATIAVVLKMNGIKISPLLAGAGILGVSLGFAAKETIADVLSGIFLIADRPLRVGDRVKIENIGRHWGGWGDVTDIGLRRTKIRNTDGVCVNYPNSMLANSVITNFSFEPQPIRVRVRFQVDFEADLERTRELVIESIEVSEDVIKGSAQMVVRSLWDEQGGHQLAGVLLEARYQIDDVRKRTRIRSEVLARILHTLRQHNIPLSAPRLRVEKSGIADNLI